MKEKVGCVPHSIDFFEVKEKIVTQRVNSSFQLQAAVDEQCNYFLDTVNVSRAKSYKGQIPLKSLCSILNSKLINFWYCLKYRMPTIGIYELHSIPIVLPKAEAQNILSLFNTLLSDQKTANHKCFKSVLDAYVFNLYFPDHMKERGIDVLQYIEHDISQIMGDEDFEKSSISRKEKVIEELYKCWSTPENEVLKRMALFDEKSPDILKPILES